MTRTCGACAVLMDGKAVNSCMVLAWQADITRVSTLMLACRWCDHFGQMGVLRLLAKRGQAS